MKFKLKLKPNKYEIRQINKFAWLPVKIKGEIRWLKKVSILQEYYRPAYSRNYGWHNFKFVD